MITAPLTHRHRYTQLSPWFAAAFDFLEKLPADQPLGRHDLDGDKCFALVQSYTTKPLSKATFEAHQRYLDIQFIQAGNETILWTPLATLTQVTQPYAAERDIAFYATPAHQTAIHLRPGDFAIFYPEDGHAPGLEYGAPTTIRKVVFKILAN